MTRQILRRLASLITALILPALLLSACGGQPVRQVFSEVDGGLSGAPLPAAAPTAAAAPAPAAAEAVAEREAPAPTPDAPVQVNPFTRTVDDNLSTFALDVDTASYSMARNYLEAGSLPPADLVRVEEFVNAFDYGYPSPQETFGITVDGAPSPFGVPNTQIVRVGIQGMTIDDSQRQPAALTFVIDISGSMADANRLPLVKESLGLLVEQLREGDTVAIVVYGDTAYTVLEPTGMQQREQILMAIASLQNQGATNAEAGLRLGYELAGKAFVRGSSNRVILCSDGVANVGETGPEGILNTIRDRAAQGIYLTTVGFGMGDYNDQLMEQLANDGNGNYAYVDDLDEAKRIFVENLTGTLQVIAKDTKAQVVFNPQVVSQYRLLGYENRAVADSDFRNDTVDAGEIGAGHTVTALYEVVLTEQATGELLSVQLRWADPASGAVREIAQPFTSDQLGREFSAAAPTLKLATTVAAFAEILRGSAYAGDRTLADVRTLAAEVAAQLANDPDVQELLRLIEIAEQLG